MTADEILTRAHRSCMDDANWGMHYARGAADALMAAGLISLSHRHIFDLALKTCPEPSHDGGRVWCAYCGDVAQPDSERDQP
jgi:hypothetical protein